MEKRTIRIKSGNKIKKKAIVSESIDSSGRILSTALVGDKDYKIIDRDYYGPIYGEGEK